MANYVFGYIIYSKSYNSLRKVNKKYFGLTDIFLSGDENSVFFKKKRREEKIKLEYKILSNFTNKYGTYYFKEQDLLKYNKIMKRIDLEIENEPDVNNKLKINRRRDNYIFVKTEKQEFLYHLANHYEDDLTFEWIGCIKNSRKKFKDDNEIVKYVFDTYINAEKNKDITFYHNINKTDEEKQEKNALKLEQLKKWKKENPEKSKECQLNWKKENRDKCLEYSRRCLYHKKLLPLKKEEINDIEKEVINILETHKRKDMIDKYCKMIIDNKQNHIIIKKVMKELEQKSVPLSISSRLSYLKKIN